MVLFAMSWIKKAVGLVRKIFNMTEPSTAELPQNTTKTVTDESKPDVTTDSGNTDTLYADIVLPGDEEHTQPIPTRITAFDSRGELSENTPSSATEIIASLDKPIGSQYEPVVYINTEFYSNHSCNIFLDDMKMYADRIGEKAAFTPFEKYWPIYKDMNQQQMAWYFYWRTEVRNGRYPDTSLSYIYVYIYELLNGCGWNDAQDGYNQLITLWTSYRERFQTLDKMLSDWTYCFAYANNLEYTAQDAIDAPLSEQPAIVNILIDRHKDDRPLRLPFVAIEALCDYAIRRSSFYKSGHQQLLKEAIPRVITLADAALIKKKRRGILSVYGPNRTKKQCIYMFISAIHPDRNKEIDVEVKGYKQSQKLRDYVNNLVRYSENVLRDLYNVRGRLRGVSLDEETATLVTAFLKKEYAPDKKLGKDILAGKNAIKLDFDNIKNLRIQSDSVREALEVCEQSDAETVFSVETDSAPFSDSEQVSADANDTVKIMSTHINESVAKHMNFDLSILPARMQDLLNALEPSHIDALYAILTQDDSQQALEQIAEIALSMPEILIDEINDISMQFLDDILIDTSGDKTCVLEQYKDELEKAVNQEGL